MAFRGADYNRWLWNYKITQFTVFVRAVWGGDDVKFTGGEGLPKSEKCEQGGANIVGIFVIT